MNPEDQVADHKARSQVMNQRAAELQAGKKTIRFRGHQVTIGATKTIFTTGEVFRPDWDDLKAVVRRLIDLGIAEDLVPNSAAILQGANRGQIDAVVPTMLERAAYRDYAHVAPFQVRACLWVLACYWHIHLGGPRPAMPMPTRQPRLQQVTMRCPYCLEKYPAPQRAMNQGYLLRMFSKWMYQHSRQHAHKDVDTSTRHIEEELVTGT